MTAAANGLSWWHGSQQAVDATIVSPVTRAGEAQPGADVLLPVELSMAPDANATTPTRPTSTPSSCALVGGRSGAEAATWLRMLAGQRASDVQAAMRAAARAPWVALWSGLLAVDAQLPSQRFCMSLLELPLAGECNVGGEAPDLHEVLADVRWQLPALGARGLASALAGAPP